MRIWLVQMWDTLRGSFWFVPLGMMFLAAVLGLSATWLDHQVDFRRDGPFAWLIVNAETARSTLSLLAGAMITLSGVVYSLTMVTLSLTSSQYGSRLLRTAMTDLMTQAALGTFLSTTLYCLVVLRFVSVNADASFVPYIAVFLGGLLAIASLVMMVVFVHNMGVSIQAQSVVAEVAHDLDAAIKHLFPERLGEAQPASEERAEDDQPELGSREEEASAITLPAATEGYLQTVNSESLMAFAVENDLIVELLYQPGDFVIRGTPLVRLVNAADELEEEKRKQLRRAVNATIMTGRSRTPRQDVCCAVNELVEVAVRALSPGINDPFTAVACIDRMTASMTRLLKRGVSSPYRYDSDGRLRVIARPVSVAAVIETAFRQIGYYGAGDSMVAMRMMEGLEQLVNVAEEEPVRDAIRRQAKQTYSQVSRTQKEPSDDERLKALLERIGEVSQAEAF